MSPETSADRIAAGFIARSSATTVFLPLVVIKTQIEWGNGSSIGDVARRIHKSEGIRGFWRGLFPTLLRDGPYSALYVLFYKSLQDSFGSERARYNVWNLLSKLFFKRELPARYSSRSFSSYSNTTGRRSSLPSSNRPANWTRKFQVSYTRARYSQGALFGWNRP